MFNIYDKVLIKSKNIIGTIVDISTIKGHTNFTVESDTPYIDEGYGGVWKLFECNENEIELA